MLFYHGYLRIQSCTRDPDAAKTKLAFVGKSAIFHCSRPGNPGGSNSI